MSSNKNDYNSSYNYSNNIRRESNNKSNPYTPNLNPINRSNSNFQRKNSQQKVNQQPYNKFITNNSAYSNANNSNSDKFSPIEILDKAKAIVNNSINNPHSNFHQFGNKNVYYNNNINDNNNIHDAKNNRIVPSEEYLLMKRREMEEKEVRINQRNISEKNKNNYNNNVNYVSNSFKNNNIKNSINPERIYKDTNNSKHQSTWNNSASTLADNKLIGNISSKNPNEQYDFSNLGLNNRANTNNGNSNNLFQNFNFNDYSRKTMTSANSNQSIPININDYNDYKQNQTLNHSVVNRNNDESFNIKKNIISNSNFDNNKSNKINNRSNSTRRNSQVEANNECRNARNSSVANKDLKNNINDSSLYNQVVPNNKSNDYYNNINKDNGSINKSLNSNCSLYNYSNSQSTNKNKDANLNNNYNNYNNDNKNQSLSYNSSSFNIGSNLKQNGNYASNFDRHRDNVTDINAELDSDTKYRALKFFKSEKNENNKFDKEPKYEDYFDTKMSEYAARTNSIYIDNSMRNPNGSEHVNNIPKSESVQLENDINNSNVYVSNKINNSLNRNYSVDSSINLKNNNNNNPYYNNESNDFDINRIKKNPQNIFNNRVDFQCIYEMEELLNKKGSDSFNPNIEINNEKVFSSSSLSKSYSKNLDDYVQVKEKKINEKELYQFYYYLLKKYEAFFEIFFDDFQKCDFSNQEKQYNKIGPISSLELYIQFKFGDFLKANEPILGIELLENQIFRWRNICGDGNCFYRAVMFSYLENILICKNNVYEFLNFIKEIFDFLKHDEIKKIFEKNNIDHDYLIRLLFFILYIKISNKLLNYKYSMYEMLLILINNSRDIDLGLVLYLRIKIFEFLEINKNKIYSQEFNVKMGNLLSEKYQADDDKFLWQLFYEENLLKLYTEAENIIIYVTPFILQINLKIFTYDIGVEQTDKVRLLSCGLPERHTAFVFYRKIHYDLIYAKEHFEKIQNNFRNYFDTTLPSVCLEKLKIQAQQALRKIKENESLIKNSNYANNNLNNNINDNNYNDSRLTFDNGSSEVKKEKMDIESQHNSNSGFVNINSVNNYNDNKNQSNKNINGNFSVCKSENNNDKTVIENPNLIDLNGSNSNNNNNNISIDLSRKENFIENRSVNPKESLSSHLNQNDKMDIDEGFFNPLNSIDIEENVKSNKNEVFNREINKSLTQKNSSFISNRANSNQIVNPIKNDQNLIPLESDLKGIQNAFANGSQSLQVNPSLIKRKNDSSKNDFSELIPKKNQSINLNNSINNNKNNNYNYSNKNNKFFNNEKEEVNQQKNDNNKNNFSIKNLTQAEKPNPQNFLCSICQEEVDLKISNFFSEALCANCFLKELKSILSIKITPIIDNSLRLLLQRPDKFFLPFDKIFRLNENEELCIFNNKTKVKAYKEFLKIDFENLIKKILAENCLVCFFADSKECQPKNFIMLPCNCSFYSLNHFKLFIKNLININTDKKNLISFTCLCNAKYSVSEVLKIFEAINENKLDEEFYALKKYLMEIYFKRFCCLCSRNLNQADLKKKTPYDLIDNMIGMFVHITVFQHFACDDCEIIIRNGRRNQKELYKPLVFPCNICGFEHLFEK